MIDLRVAASDAFSPAALDALAASESGRYPTAEQVHTVELVGNIDAAAKTTSMAQRQERIGCAIRAVQNQAMANLQRDGFGFSRLQPYVGWEAMRDEAHRLWNAYRVAVRPKTVTRLGVRYINRIDLPLPAGEIREYLLTGPTLAPAMPQLIAGYAMELRLPQPGIARGGALVRQALVQPPRPGVASIAFDIDVFQETDFKPDDEDIWASFEMLHSRENLLFESSITDKVREIIDQ